MNPNSPAGWYPDPTNAQQKRYWDGQRWTAGPNASSALQPTPQLAGVKGQKSVAAGVILTILFGPFGLFYVGASYGFWAIGFAIVMVLLASVTFGISIIVYWIVLIIAIVKLVKKRNAQLMAGPANPAPGLTQPSITAPPAPSLAMPATTTPKCVVHVVGAVKRPGVYHLPQGSRLDDAIKAAGGVLEGVDVSTMNMARTVTDGEQITVT